MNGNNVAVAYVTDTPYADTFFRELSPAWLNYVAALGGMAPRRVGSPFQYLELGAGLGTSSVINAAAYPHASFHACDFNATHIEAARAYASRLGVINLTLYAEPFEALSARRLPMFDFIVLHGVYSWVDVQTRDVLRQLLARQLAPGGIVYVSYNALPGWAIELPLRKLLVEFADAAEGNAAARSEAAAAAVQALSAAGFRYFTANPAAKSAVDAYTRGGGRYLAHEFMNAAWEPFYAVDVVEAFAAIGLEPVGSATLSNNHLPLILDARAAEAIAALATPRQQLLAIDFAINQRFRRDVFVRAEGHPQARGHLDAAPIGCVTGVEEIAGSVRVPRGEIRFQDAFIADVRALMAQGSWCVGEAVSALSHGGQDRAGVARNLLFLVASGALAPFARAQRVPGAPPTRLANPVVERALVDMIERGVPRHVPSEVYGNGVAITADDARWLLDWSRGRTVPAEFIAQRLPTLARTGLVA